MGAMIQPVFILGIMGAAFGILLGVAAKAFKVEKDERVEKVPAQTAAAAAMPAAGPLPRRCAQAEQI